MAAIPLILRLDVMGRPVSWMPWQEAVSLYSKKMVAWTAGEHMFQLHGGVSRRTGQRSLLEINSIIAIKGEFRQFKRDLAPPLNNRELFRRDSHLCLYCGREHADKELTRDHVLPISRGGRDIWANVVSSCKRCNTRKGCKTPEEANMRLLAVPYVPNIAEYLVLRNRRILADQNQFLRLQFKNTERTLMA